MYMNFIRLVFFEVFEQVFSFHVLVVVTFVEQYNMNTVS